MTNKQKKLLTKVKAGLSNPEVKDEDILSATSEADSIIGDKSLSEALYLDIAMYRFISIIGNTPNEMQDDLYKMAIKELNKLPNVLDNKKYYPVQVKQRKSF